MGPQVDLDEKEEIGDNTVLNDAGKYTPNKQTPKTKNSNSLFTNPVIFLLKFM